jgi:DNA-binding response OmpR family regulator
MAGKTILIIDTDTETIQKIMSTLESEGYLVFSASSKEVSITMANKVKPSLIFINVGLSGASGLEICKTIHDAETLGSVPIVMITPHGGAIDPRYTSLYGIVDFLKKPFTPEELILKTENLLSIESGVAHTVGESVATSPVEEAVEAQPVDEEFDFEIFEEEGIRTEPLEKEIKAKRAEDETEPQLEEEWTPGESVQKEIEAKAPEKKSEVKAGEDELETLLVEEEVESRKSKEPETAGKKESVQKVVPEKTVSDKGEIERMWSEGKIEEEKIEQGPQETEETYPESAAASEEPDKSYIPKRRMSERGRKSRLLVPLIILLVVVAGAGGFVLYKIFWKETGFQTLTAVRPSKPVKPPAPMVESLQETQKPQEAQKPQQKVEEGKPALPPAPASAPARVPSAAPVTSPAPKVKPSAKMGYSVQIGVFKSEANAAAFSRKYKEKGYDAFTHKSTLQDKGIVYRVLLGNSVNKKEAVKFADSVRDKEKIGAVVFHE